VFVTDIDTFIGLRFVQAIGSCAATVASVSMVRDLFPRYSKVFSLLMLVVGLSPMLAPTVGGYVTEYGWHVVFYTDVHGILIFWQLKLVYLLLSSRILLFH
jgi:DHA1 family bicyclomycin/chloramphenicol resistance-like MFS transporter